MNTRLPIPLRVLAIVLLLALSAHAAYAATWNIETVDTYLVGKFSSIAVDPAGAIHISYYDAFNGNLKYAAYYGGAWHIEIVTGVGKNSLWAYTAIAVSSTGVPNIVFYDDNQKVLKLAIRAGNTWSIETIDATGGFTGFFASIALDASDKPHVSYLGSQGSGSLSGELKYAVKSGTTWSVETVDTDGDTGFDTSIALDSSGRPHISYVRYPSPGARSSSILKYATRAPTGGPWTIEDVDSSIPTDYTAIALDASGVPHISYHDRQNDYLMYATRSGGTWLTAFVDASGDVGPFTSIAIGPTGIPHIAYYDITHQYLKYATLGVAGVPGWSTEVVDASRPVGSYCDIALDPSGLVHISYYDSTYAYSFALKHAAMMPPPQPSPQGGNVVPISPQEFPYKVTAEIKCTESIAGVCLRKEITRVCVGGNCFDVREPRPPICVRCYLALSAVVGLVAGAISNMYLARRRRRSNLTSPTPPPPGQPL